MDNKNVFVAIALSMSVLLFWAAFFEQPRPVENKIAKKQVENSTENSITPNINEVPKIDSISRSDSIKQSKRIKIENNSITGSMNLKGGLIDDISFKKHKKNKKSQSTAKRPPNSK